MPYIRAFLFYDNLSVDKLGQLCNHLGSIYKTKVRKIKDFLHFFLA